MDISNKLPKYPYDTTIINNGADTIIAQITDISFINDDEGWVTTWHPFNTDSAAILHTTDGGDSWEVQMIFRPCNVIHMVNESLGWAGSDQGLIFITTNGGDSWTVQGVTGANITGMSFVPGTDTGYICSYDITHFHRVTPNGVNAISLDSPGWWASISAPSNDLIWISAATSVVTYDLDGVTDQPITSATYNNLYFYRNNLGWACGYEGVKDRNQGVITGCVGKNIPWVHLQYTDCPMNHVFALDQDHVWAVGFCGQIYYSENASQFDRDSLTGSWWSNVVFSSQDHPKPEMDLWVIYFSSLNNGYAAGRDNTLLRYSRIFGIDELPEVKADIWPNPVNSTLNIHCPGVDNQKVNIDLVDLSGKIVMKLFEGINDRGSMECDVSQLPSGIYFLKISGNDIVLIKKIFKVY